MSQDKKHNNSNKEKQITANKQVKINNKNIQINNEEQTQEEIELQELESLQKEGVKTLTKNRKFNRRFFVTLIIILCLVVVGASVAMFFIFRGEEKEVPLIAKVDVMSYRVVGEDKYLIAKDSYNYEEQDSSTNNFSQGLNCELGVDSYARLVFLVDNRTVNEYIYTINFESLLIENCEISYYTDINPVRTYVSNNHRVAVVGDVEDMLITVEIKCANFNLDAVCAGNIILTLSTI